MDKKGSIKVSIQLFFTCSLEQFVWTNIEIEVAWSFCLFWISVPLVDWLIRRTSTYESCVCTDRWTVDSYELVLFNESVNHFDRFVKKNQLIFYLYLGSIISAWKLYFKRTVHLKWSFCRVYSHHIIPNIYKSIVLCNTTKVYSDYGH